MATLFFAKDGSRPAEDEWGPFTQSGGGVTLSTTEALELIGTGRCLFRGVEAPSINPGPVSGSEKHVVLEIKEEDDLLSYFIETGFYHLPDLTPTQAKERIAAIRGAV
jgi:hypothetical protein